MLLGFFCSLGLFLVSFFLISSLAFTPCTGSALMFTTLYDVTQESMMYKSDGSVDGGLEGPQAKIVVEIITLRN